MLRITIKDEDAMLRLIVEGRLVAAWVVEAE
jgi:hypothetical protein